MRLAVWEWRKQFRLPALWVFVGLCLVFNGLLLAGPSAQDRAFFNDTSADASLLGQRVDVEFLAGLDTLPDTENRALLRLSVTGLENTLEGYDTGELTDFYQNLMEGDPLAQSWMAWKYDLLQARVDHLAQTGAALDLYAGPITYNSHQYLYDTLFRAVVAESILLGLLCALYLVGYEGMSGTRSLTCASRTGRRLWRSKTLAALAAALGLYALLALLTLGPYLLLWDYGGIWSASVSSQFNYLVDMLYSRPFLTWADFTVGSYFAAMVVAGGALVAVFTLIGTVAGLLVGNTYGAAIAAAALCALIIGLSSLLVNSLGLWWAYLLTTFSPAHLWLAINGWFTELGQGGLVPWQETVGLTLNLLVWGGFTLLALRRFGRKDVA
ncbi:hypothetical protein [Flavonifractor sp. An306]|uniref:hypothetical protein n=1 Tax=Flavonifractor sp. An306 TaxID=1965629 RepID=UPI000B37DC6E|nr:hypothetical protein [Flavonifractor sp. An306]OUO44518.1 hypothetical protein B5F88_01210 [Flavonifractor sp. An306]